MDNKWGRVGRRHSQSRAQQDKSTKGGKHTFFKESKELRKREIVFIIIQYKQLPLIEQLLHVKNFTYTSPQNSTAACR